MIKAASLDTTAAAAPQAHACSYPATHHSADVLEVWHGATTPLYVCGYHNASVPLSTLVRLAS